MASQNKLLPYSFSYHFVLSHLLPTDSTASTSKHPRLPRALLVLSQGASRGDGEGEKDLLLCIPVRGGWLAFLDVLSMQLADQKLTQ